MKAITTRKSNPKAEARGSQNHGTALLRTGMGLLSKGAAPLSQGCPEGGPPEERITYIEATDHQAAGAAFSHGRCHGKEAISWLMAAFVTG